MTKTFNNAEVCESAENLLRRVCYLVNIPVTDEPTEEDEEEGRSYSEEVQPLFDVIHDHIEKLLEEYGIVNEIDTEAIQQREEQLQYCICNGEELNRKCTALLHNF